MTDPESVMRSCHVRGTSDMSDQRRSRSLQWRSGVAGLIVLHLILAWLWPDRSHLGFAMAFGPWEESPALGWPVVLPWVMVLVLAVGARMVENHRTAPLGLSTTGANGLRLQSLAMAILAYAGAALIGMVVGKAVGFHFALSIGQYALFATVCAGMILAGRRSPFLEVSLSRPPSDGVRRAANWLTVGLSSLMYLEWIFDRQVWSWLYDLSTWWSLIIPIAMAIPCVVLGWALLHCSMMDLARRLVAALERRAESSVVAVGMGSRWLEWSGQLIAAASILVVLRWSARVIAGRWENGTWIFGSGFGEQVFLGVDWYFVKARPTIIAGEIFVLIAFFVVGGRCVAASRTTKD